MKLLVSSAGSGPHEAPNPTSTISEDFFFFSFSSASVVLHTLTADAVSDLHLSTTYFGAFLSSPLCHTLSSSNITQHPISF